MSRLFRAEAVAYRAVERRGGALLELTPAWTRLAFPFVVAVVVAALVAAWTVRIHEYASGPGIVRVDGRADVTAKSGGTVARVLARPGDRVAAGDPLVQLDVDEEDAELERTGKEFDLQLLKVLRDADDQAARQTLSSLRAQRDLAQSRVERRLVRAPAAGIVSDVRIRPGQHLAVGELLLAVVREDAPLSLIALVPGRYRPMLRRGMPLRFELSGYRYEWRELPIASVGDQVIGPAEAKRFLGADVADGLALHEPVVLVRATIPSRSFLSDGERYEYYDGLHAEVLARVRSERVLYRIVPALRELFGHER
jgi:multidrug efflux pump subunit AcrA (membrane-fusion protein)